MEDDVGTECLTVVMELFDGFQKNSGISSPSADIKKAEALPIVVIFISLS